MSLNPGTRAITFQAVIFAKLLCVTELVNLPLTNKYIKIYSYIHTSLKALISSQDRLKGGVKLYTILGSSRRQKKSNFNLAVWSQPGGAQEKTDMVARKGSALSEPKRFLV